MLLASGRTLVGAEEAAAARHRHGLAHAPAQQRGGYSHVAPGARVSGQGQRSPIIMCLEVCHRLHYRPVLDKYVDCCAPTGWSGRHVDDTTMSNRIRFAVHLDANVHLTPRDQLEAMAVALVADKAGLRVCALGCAVGAARCRHGYARGVNYAKMRRKTPIPTRNLKQFTIKTQQFINRARSHCFLSRFDHRGPTKQATR